MKRILMGLLTICCVLASLDARAGSEDKAITKLIQSVSHAMVEPPKAKQ